MIISPLMARVYGTASMYGAEPRLAPPNSPYILADYPLEGDTSSIALGPPDIAIVTAEKVAWAIVKLIASPVEGGPVGNAEALSQAVFEELAAPVADKWTRHNWYVTLLVQRSIKVEDQEITDNPYFWLDINRAIQIENDMKSYGAPHLDHLESYVRASLPPQFFEHLVIYDRVYFNGDQRAMFRLPQFAAGGPITVSSNGPMELFDDSALRAAISSAVAKRDVVLGALPLPKLVHLVETALDSDMKGRVLEEVVARLLGTVPGFVVTDQRVRTETEEIDIFVMNDSGDPRFKREGAIVIAECKNWSGKCGKNEFVIFLQKIENRNKRSTLGFLVSWNGFAETVNKEMLRGSREEALIVPISGEEIKAGVASGDFMSTLTAAWERAVNL